MRNRVETLTIHIHADLTVDLPDVDRTTLSVDENNLFTRCNPLSLRHFHARQMSKKLRYSRSRNRRVNSWERIARRVPTESSFGICAATVETDESCIVIIKRSLRSPPPPASINYLAPHTSPPSPQESSSSGSRSISSVSRDLINVSFLWAAIHILTSILMCDGNSVRMRALFSFKK